MSRVLTVHRVAKTAVFALIWNSARRPREILLRSAVAFVR